MKPTVIGPNTTTRAETCLRLTRETAERCESRDLTDRMAIGISAIVATEMTVPPA